MLLVVVVVSLPDHARLVFPARFFCYKIRKIWNKNTKALE
jgi:hypothetical protein